MTSGITFFVAKGPRGRDDGLFDVTVGGGCGRAALLKVLPKVYEGTYPGHPAVTVHRVSSTEPAAAGVTACADGGPFGALPVLATRVPGAVGSSHRETKSGLTVIRGG